MKNLIAKPLLLVILIISPFIIRAQEDLVEYFPAGAADSKLLIDGYISTMGEIIGAGINNGWYTNGAPHGKFGVEFNITFNTIFVPSSDDFYATPTLTNARLDDIVEIDFDPINPLNSTLSTGGNTTQVPSLYGPILTYPIFGYASSSPNATHIDPITGLAVPTLFKGPHGNSLKKQFQINAVVVPTMQLSIGIIKNTDLKIRFVPELDFDGTKFGTWGVGIMHSIKDHIPGLKLTPFGWSLLVAYSQLNGETDLSGQWLSSSSAVDFASDAGQANQIGEFTTNGITIQTIVSKKFSVITVYGAVGYNNAKTKFDLKGTYYIDEVNANPISGLPPILAPLNQPVTIDAANDFTTFEYENTGLRFTSGVRLKLGPITFHGDYTIQRTNVLTFGLGFSVKE